MSVVKVRIAQSRTRLKRLSSSSSSSSISCVCTYKHKSTYLLLYFFALYHLRFTHLERITDTEKYIIRTLNNNYNFRGNARLFDSFIWSLKNLIIWIISTPHVTTTNLEKEGVNLGDMANG